MSNPILARFDNYTVRRGPNGKLYIARYRAPHLIYSVDAFLTAALDIPWKVRVEARDAIDSIEAPVAVVHYPKNAKRGKVLRRFKKISQAEDFLATSATIDPDDLVAGNYSIDAPEEMVNPRRKLAARG